VLGVITGSMLISLAFSDNSESLYAKNEYGITYGTMEAVTRNPTLDPPELIACMGVDGTVGYCYKKDLDGDLPSTPEEALKYMKEINKQNDEATAKGEIYLRYIPLYEADGITVIGEFGLSYPVSEFKD